MSVLELIFSIDLQILDKKINRFELNEKIIHAAIFFGHKFLFLKKSLFFFISFSLNVSGNFFVFFKLLMNVIRLIIFFSFFPKDLKIFLNMFNILSIISFQSFNWFVIKWVTIDTVLDIFKLSIFLFILTLNLKSAFLRV